MPNSPSYPGVYVQAIPSSGADVPAVATAITAFVGRAARGPVDEPVAIGDFAEFERHFGGLSRSSEMSYAVRDYFANGGQRAVIVRLHRGPVEAAASDTEPLVEADYIGPGLEAGRRGLYALERTDLFTLLCLPPDFAPAATYPGRLAEAAIDYCTRRRAVFLYDPSADWHSAADVLAGLRSLPRSANAALYFPRIVAADPLDGNRPRVRVPSGAVAGVMARTDAARGVWKAPAGREATLRSITGLDVALTNDDSRRLNPRAVNCLRTFPRLGTVAWGARTLAGDDRAGSEYQYLPARRTALFVEESLYRGLGWAVFEPNNERLWSRIRRAVENFLESALFRKGGLQGDKSDEAFYVRCDASTMTANDIAKGRVIVEIGLALVKPAEFVIVRIAQITAEH